MTSVPPRFGVPAVEGAAVAVGAAGVAPGDGATVGGRAAAGATVAGGAADWHAASRNPVAPSPRCEMNWRLFMTRSPQCRQNFVAQQLHSHVHVVGQLREHDLAETMGAGDFDYIE
jgi:hypothetical protein